MATNNSAIFEAPGAHEVSHPYSNPEDYSSPELEWEDETNYANPYSNPESYSNPYSNPEWEDETNYANPYSNPEGYSNPYSNPEWEDETNYANPYSNPEDYSNPYSSPESYSNPYSNPEWESEDESDAFFKKAFRAIGRVAKIAAPLAKRLAPFAARALVGMIPGVGAVAGPLAGKLTSALLSEGEAEAMSAEAEFFGTNEAEAEVGNTQMAHAAALTELLAAEAAESESEAESSSLIAATLPITISIMGGQRAVQTVVPTLAQATGRLTQVLRRQGPAGRQLLRTVPAIERRAVATLGAAARSGRPVTGPMAVRAMAAATRNVLGNTRKVQQAVTRNAVLRQRVAPPHPRRTAIFAPRGAPSPTRRQGSDSRSMPGTRRRVPA